MLLIVHIQNSHQISLPSSHQRKRCLPDFFDLLDSPSIVILQVEFFFQTWVCRTDCRRLSSRISQRLPKIEIDTSRYDGRDNKLHLNEIPIPEPKPHELLIKMACASLCHSDLMMFEPNDQGLIMTKEPVSIGHEGAGYVAKVGSGVSGFKEGDPVGFIPAKDCCYECEPCKTSHNSWCVTGKINMHGFSVNGYFQEYVCIDAKAAMVLPEGLDPVEAAPLFCAGVTSYHGVDDCELKPGQWMAVIGVGGLGHLGVQYAK